VINQKIVNVKGFSPRYTAPEVFGRMAINLTTVTVEDEMKSDVYSYAVILWEMMTRKLPWAHRNLISFHFLFFIFVHFILIFIFWKM